MKSHQGITFRFKQFGITDGRCGLKLGTDGVLLGAWSRLPFAGATSAADVGTGCGIIALMLVQRFDPLHITAIDVDAGAVADASDNFVHSPWSQRLNALAVPFRELSGRFDLLISNPPFFTSGELSPRAERAASRHTAAGLSPALLIERAPDLLSLGGSLQMITPADMEADVVCRATFARLCIRRLCRVSTVAGKAPSRLLWELTPADCATEYTTLDLRTPGGALSPEWQRLTKDFYLDKDHEN